MDGHILISLYSQYMKKHHLHVSRTQIDSVKETSLNNLIPFSPFHLFGNGSHSFFQLVTSYLGSLRNRKKIHCAQKLIKSVLIQFVVSLKMAQNSTFFFVFKHEFYSVLLEVTFLFSSFLTLHEISLYFTLITQNSSLSLFPFRKFRN